MCVCVCVCVCVIQQHCVTLGLTSRHHQRRLALIIDAKSLLLRERGRERGREGERGGGGRKRGRGRGRERERGSERGREGGREREGGKEMWAMVTGACAHTHSKESWNIILADSDSLCTVVRGNLQ